MGDLNERVGYKVKDDIACAFGVLDESGNGRHLRQKGIMFRNEFQAYNVQRYIRMAEVEM